MMRTTGTAWTSTITQAVDHLRHPRPTLGPIVIFGLLRGFRVQDFNTTRAASFPKRPPRCRVHPITVGNEPQTGQTRYPNRNLAKTRGICTKPYFLCWSATIPLPGRSEVDNCERGFSEWSLPGINRARLVHSSGRVHPGGRHGRRILHGPRAEGLLSALERR